MAHTILRIESVGLRSRNEGGGDLAAKLEVRAGGYVARTEMRLTLTRQDTIRLQNAMVDLTSVVLNRPDKTDPAIEFYCEMHEYDTDKGESDG